MIGVTYGQADKNITLGCSLRGRKFERLESTTSVFGILPSIAVFIASIIFYRKNGRNIRMF